MASMSRVLEFLDDEDLAFIAGAPPDMPVVEVARRLGRPYFTVHKAVQRIRRDGWLTRLYSTTCVACGGPILYPAHWKPLTHPGECRRARVAERARHRRAGPHLPSTKYVNAWRERDPAGNARLRTHERERAKDKRQEWTPEQWAPVLERVHESDRQGQLFTLDRAKNSGALWTEDEDRYIWEHLKTAARDVGLVLGRTLYAVRGRRVYLRRQHEDTLDQRDKMAS